MKEYQKQALEVASNLTTPEELAECAGLSLASEVGEILDVYKRHRYYKIPLDTKNLIEEVGDVLWCLAIGYHSIGMEMPEVQPMPETEIPLDTLLAKLAHHSANVCSIVLMYKDDWRDQQLDYDLHRIFNYLSYYVRQELHCSLEDAAEANIKKLSKRYPGMVFSTERALSRDKEHELSHIN